MAAARRITLILNSLAGLSIIVCTIAPQVRTQNESGNRLEPKVAGAAIDAFKLALDERWSYRYANRADFDAAIAALRKRIERDNTQSNPGITMRLRRR